MPPRIPPCYKTTYEAKQLIPELYVQSQTDSIIRLLNYWEKQCGGAYDARQVRILLEIKGDTFKVSEKKDLLNTLLDFKRSPMEYETNTNGYVDYYPTEWEEVESGYKSFIINLANDARTSRNVLKQQEDDILKYYSGDETSLFKNLRKKEYAGTYLQAEYDEIVDDYRYNSGAVFAVYAGSWIPTNNLSRLGTHPDLGLKLGYYENRFNVDLHLGIRFVDAPSEYRVRKDDSTYQSDQFSSFYAGVDMGYAIYRGVRHQFDVTAGLGYDQITMFSSDEETGEGGLTIRSFNVKAGVEYKYFYNIKNYLALGCSYNFLNYQNNINDDLYGGAVSVHLIWGFTSDHNKRRDLKELGY